MKMVRGSGKGHASLFPKISHRTYLVSILGIRRGLTATITHKIILHDVFGVALLFAHWTIHHCQDKNGNACTPSDFLTSPITFCTSVSRPGNGHWQRPGPVPRPLLNQQAYLTLPGPPYSRTGAVPSTGCEEGEGHLATQYSLAPSPAEPPSPELFAAAGVAGPRQALQAECRQGSSRGSRSGRRRSRHTPQCSRSSCASPPPPAGDDAAAEAAAAEEAAGRFSPPAEPSPDPGLPEAAEAAVAAEAAAVAAAEAAIHTPPGGGGGRPGEEGHGARCAGASALAANGQAAADAARPSAATRLLGRRPPRPRRCRDAAKPLAAGLCTDDGAATSAASSLASETLAPQDLRTTA